MSFALDLHNLAVQTGCCIGSKGYDLAILQSQGVVCNDTELKYMIRAQKVLLGWYPEGYVICAERPAVYIFNYQTLPLPHVYTLFVPDGKGGTITLFNANAPTIDDIVDAINASTDFTAQKIGFNVWIYAPYGYNGLLPSGTLISELVGESAVLTTFGFQNGCKGKIALKPCLTQQQIQKVGEDLQRICGVCSIPDNITPKVTQAPN